MLFLANLCFTSSSLDGVMVCQPSGPGSHFYVNLLAGFLARDCYEGFEPATFVLIGSYRRAVVGIQIMLLPPITYL